MIMVTLYGKEGYFIKLRITVDTEFALMFQNLDCINIGHSWFTISHFAI